MPSLPTAVFFFGDQAHAASSNGPLLNSLRRRAAASSKLPFDVFVNQRLGDVVGDQQSLLEWAEKSAYEVDDELAPTASALVPAIAQLGSLVWKCQQDDRILTDGGAQYIIGQCSGLILACGLAAARDLYHLVELSAEMLRIIVRVTYFAVQRSREIEEAPAASWACAVHLPKDECLAALGSCQDHSTTDELIPILSQPMPAHKQAYVSFEIDGWCAVSGPPSTLRLVMAKAFAGVPHRELPIFAAYHAGHLRAPNYDKLVGSSKLLDVPIRPGVKVLSSSTGEPLDCSSLRNALLQALRDILELPSNLSRVLATIMRGLKETSEQPVLHVFGPAVQWKGFVRHLDMAGARSPTISALGNCQHNYETNEVRHGDEDDGEARVGGDEDNLIAITGFSGKFPGAENCDELWNLVRDGRVISREMPAERVVADDLPRQLPKGCYLDGAGQFDAGFFGMSRRAAIQTDPAHRLLLHKTQEALDMSGYNPACHTSRVGTFIGQATDDWREHNMRPQDAYYVTGGLRAFGPGRLNHFFGWDGPSLSVDTACSSSGVALDLAVQALRARKCDMAVAGGVNIITGDADVGMCAGLSAGGFLGVPGTACKTFDAAADGYTRGEAVAVVVLKRLGDARKDNDTVHGVVRAVATNHSTDTNPITRPSKAAQETLLRQALREALVEPADVSYVEMHGSGTQAGDRTEMEAVAAVFGGDRGRQHRYRRSSGQHGRGGGSGNVLRVGSVKANVGHSEGAAGITAVVKSLLVLRYGCVPPNVGLTTGPNPAFPPLGDLGIRINMEEEPLVLHADHAQRHRRRPDVVVVNCFGAAGGNTSIVLEGPSEHDSLDHRRSINETENGSQHAHVVAVSAKSRSALRAYQLRLLSFLEQRPFIPVRDISYTTCTRRRHYQFRSAYLAQDTTELLAQLRKDVSTAADVPSSGSLSAPLSPQVVFVFAGQGTKVVGSARHLSDSNRVFREALRDYSEMSQTLGFPGVLQYLTTAESLPVDTAPEDSRKKTAAASLEQVSLVVLELALSRMWESWGVRPSAVLGHSLGEYAALQASGVLSAADTIWLVGTRARIMEKTCKRGQGRMLAVFLHESRLSPFLANSKMEIACRNTPSQTVVAGPVDEISALQEQLRRQNIRSVLTSTPYAFHSSMMDGILHELHTSACTVTFGRPEKTQLVSTLTGSLIDTCPSWPEHLVRHSRLPVSFPEAVQSAMALDPGRKTLFLAISPTPACRDMLKANITTAVNGRAEVIDAMHIDSTRCSTTIAVGLAQAYSSGLNIDWARFDAGLDEPAGLLEMPPYAFDLEDFWIPTTRHRGGASQSPPAPSLPPTKSSLIHALEQADDLRETTTTFTSDLTRKPFPSLISGHAIRGQPVCPAGVFVDLAFAAVLRMLGDQADASSVELKSLRFVTPVTISQGDVMARSQTLKTVLTKGVTSSEFVVNFIGGERETRHASCLLQTVEPADVPERAINTSGRFTTHQLLGRASRMLQLRGNATADHFTRPMVYRIWQPVMQYSAEYNVIQDLWMAPAGYEAAAKISMPLTEKGSENDAYVVNPVWMDGVMQVAGFSVNMNADTKPGAVYILAECGRISFWDRPQAERVYTCHANGHLQKSGDVLMSVWVFDEQHDMRLIAAIDDMRFHELGRAPERKKRSSAAIDLPLRSLSVGSPRPVLSKPVGDSESSGTTINTPTTSRGSSDASDTVGYGTLLDRLIRVLRKETLAGPGEISGKTELEDLGVDSLLISSVAESIYAELGVQIPLLALMEAVSVDDVVTLAARFMRSTSAREEEYTPTPLSMEPEVYGTINGASFAAAVPDHMHPVAASFHRGSEELRISNSDGFSSKVVLLQGCNDDKNKMFFLPDASGSSAVYGGLPPLLSAHTNTAIFALESPFYKLNPIPEVSMEDYCSIFVDAILRTQPAGPYMLGGWSIGGRFAYECARQLIRRGHTVSGLLLIESYALHVPHLPAGPDGVSVEHVERTGLFGRLGNLAAPPEWQKAHVHHAILVNSGYTPPSLAAADGSGEEVPVELVWSREGDFSVFPAKILQAKMEIENEGAMGKHTDDMGAWLRRLRPEATVAEHSEQWGRLSDGCVKWHIVDGDHFDIMLPKVRGDLARVIETAVLRFLCAGSAA